MVEKIEIIKLNKRKANLKKTTLFDRERSHKSKSLKETLLAMIMVIWTLLSKKWIRSFNDHLNNKDYLV